MYKSQRRNKGAAFPAPSVRHEQMIPISQAKKVAAEAAHRAIRETTTNFLAATALCAHDKLGFGPARAQRFIAQIQDAFDSVTQGYCSLEDMQKVVQDELGITFIGVE